MGINVLGRNVPYGFADGVGQPSGEDTSVLQALASAVNSHQTTLNALSGVAAEPTGVANIAAFGAVAWDQANPNFIPDCSPAFKAALASAANTIGALGQPYAVVEVPTGIYYISEPIWLKNSQTRLIGQGREASIIKASDNFGGPGQSGANGFAGPMLIAGPGIQPTYGPDLFGGAGRSMKLAPGQYSYVVLRDAYCWNMDGMTAFCVEGRFKLNSTASGNIIGSGGYKLDVNATNLGAQAFYVAILNIGSGPFFSAQLTTVNGVFQLFSSTIRSVGDVVDFAISYDGANFRLYENGVHSTSAAATGAVKQEAFEGVCIGQINNEVVNVGSPSVDGWVQSIRLSRTAVRSGTGSYTRPSAPFTAPFDTLALYNWDQGDPSDPLAPWVKGQVFFNYTTPPPAAIHYCRLSAGAAGSFSGPRFIENLGFNGGATWGQSGVVLPGCFESLVRSVFIGNMKYLGISHADGASFYSRHEDMLITGCTVGYLASAYASVNVTIVGNEIPAWLVAGTYYSPNVQPNSKTVFPFVLGAGSFGGFSKLELVAASSDAEGVFPKMRCGAVINNSAVITRSCFFLAAGGDVPNVLIAAALPIEGWRSIGDIFGSADGNTKGHIELATGTPVNGPIVVDAFLKSGTGVPWTTSAGITRIQMPSYEDAHFHGKVTISGATTTAPVDLSTLELPPGTYDVVLTPGNPVGGPAAGAFTAYYSGKTSSGFTINLSAAPGVGKSMDVDWSVRAR